MFPLAACVHMENLNANPLLARRILCFPLFLLGMVRETMEKEMFDFLKCGWPYKRDTTNHVCTGKLNESDVNTSEHGVLECDLATWML